MPSPQLLFVVGLGRSGTTALTDLLSAHPGIGLGMERYKFFYKNRDWPLTPENFSRERFFDFTDGGTNIRPDLSPRWREYYDAVDAKWDGLRYVGDKASVVRLSRLREALPEARVVCIVRDIRSTAASWAARAANPQDENWPARRGARAAVAPWNKALTAIAATHRRAPDLVSVLEYDHLFGDPAAAALRHVVASLDLPWDPALQETFDRSHERYVTAIRAKERTLPPDVEQHVAEHADLDAWTEVLGHAL